MSCVGAEGEERRQGARIELPKPRPPGRTSFACRSCSTDFIRARAKITLALTKPNRFPVRSARRWPPRRKNTAWRSSARSSNAAPPGVYHNTAVVFDADGRTAGMYRKMHIPDDPNYYEKFYFTPGDLGFMAIDTRVRPRRTAGLLGSMVSRGGAADGLARCPDFVLSDGHRLAARGKGGIRRRASTRPGKP